MGGCPRPGCCWFPTVADVVAPTWAASRRRGRRLEGRDWVANGNLVLRQLGVPTVIVSMGILTDIGMTFAARAYEDAFPPSHRFRAEATGDWRVPRPLTPPL